MLLLLLDKKGKGLVLIPKLLEFSVPMLMSVADLREAPGAQVLPEISDIYITNLPNVPLEDVGFLDPPQ